MLNIILIAAAVVLVLLLVVVAMQPSDFRVTRMGRISAPVNVTFENVNDLHKWNTWSPWMRMDPNCKNTFSGADSGPGASMAWAGNKKVGEGRMTITDARENERIQIKLEFLKPFKATNIAEFTFKAEGGQTAVTWAMTGKNNFMGKAFWLLMNCEKMVGGDFERGLANLNEVVGAKTVAAK